jgi:Asp-tRNA(Asn)/Glu-tRNA(Gln) amidotransferase A subunit family amidase
MVPLAIGTQTNGSIIRPASFCGVLGYKPSHGLVSRHRVLPQSRLLDHVGVFSRSTEDAALLAEQLIGHDGNDPDTRPRARFRLLEAARQAPPAGPRLAFVRTPVWDEGEADARAAIDDLVRSLGDDIEEQGLPAVFDNAIEWHRLVFEADLARSYRREYEQGREKLSTVLREMIERGQRVVAVDYKAAREGRDTLRAELDKVFERFDALVTPAVKGQAPKGLDSTGSPVFCTLWTLCGAPAISLPLMRGEDGMPIGVQLVGRPGEDERLLTMAAWRMKRVEG